jgi:probable phosphoglycerate mutase
VITFARHGQTAMNRDGRLQGRLDVELSELGLRQAAALGRALATKPVTRVVSSPLRRARDTAAAIASAHNLTVDVDERLVELDYGDWDGRALQEIGAEHWATWRTDPGFAPPNGERLADVTARVAAFLADAADDSHTVAVSHVSPIKAAVCCALGVEEQATWRMQLDVAAITRVGVRPDGSAFLLSYNETAHLRDLV